jgi:hypothetical protein
VRRSPWFWPIARAAERVGRSNEWPRLADFDALHAEFAAPAGVAALRFGQNVRKQEKRAQGRIVLDALYDGRIASHGEVPTREGDWHDLFNALCFATFPRAKLALHTRQYQALQRRIGADARAMPGARTAEQDALTLFDEGGVAIAALPAAADQLERVTSETLPSALVQLEQNGHARVVPFGHALFEHLVEGLICPRGGTRVVVLEAMPHDDAALLDAVDRGLCALLHDPHRFQSPKEHLHVRFNSMNAAPAGFAP